MPNKQDVTKLDPKLLFNLNTYCKVKLTARGLEILSTEAIEYFNHNYNARKNILETSLWVIMQIFGKHMYNGGPTIFINNEIQIGSKLK